MAFDKLAACHYDFAADSFMNIRPLFNGLLGSFVVVAALAAQEPPAKDKPAEKPAETAPAAATPATPAAATSEPQTPAARFAALNSEWQALDKRLKVLEQTYSASTSIAARAETKKQYEELIAQSSKLLPELRAAAEAAYVAEPNKDPAVTRLLVGMVAYDVRRDDYEPALKLARLLEEHKCAEAVLFEVAGAAAYNSDDYETAERFFALADKAGRLGPANKQLQAELPEQKKAWAVEQEIRTKEAAANDLPRVKLETSKGQIVIELFENEAPQAVGNFVSLVEKKVLRRPDVSPRAARIHGPGGRPRRHRRRRARLRDLLRMPQTRLSPPLPRHA